MINLLGKTSSIEPLSENAYNLDLIGLEERLFDAINRNSISEINEILCKNPSLVNANFITGNESPLILAVKLGNFEVVKLLIEFDVEIPTYSIYFKLDHPLDIAVKNNDIKIAEIIIEAISQGMVDDSQISKYQYPQYYQGSSDYLRNSIVNQDDYEYQDLLVKAILNQRDFIIIELLTNFLKNVKKIDLKSIQYSGNNLLHLSWDYQTFKFFLEQGFDINSKNNENSTAISLSISRGLTDIVRYLLAEKKFQINQILDVDEGYSAIHFAILGENFEMMDFLIANGADIKIMAKDGKNILGVAITEGKINVVKKIIEILEKKYPDDFINFLNHFDEDELSPIHIAIEADCCDIVEFLLEFDINLIFFDQDKNLLYYSNQFNHLKILEVLIEKKYNLYLKNPQGKKFLEDEGFFLKIILKENNYKIIKMLHDCEVNFKDIFLKLTIDSVAIKSETHNFIYYLEECYRNEILDKFTQAYRKFKDQIDIKFDKKDKINFPTFCLFEIMIFVDADLRGGIKKTSQIAKEVIDFIAKNPHSLEVFDKISQDFLAACSLKPAFGFFQIATLAVSTKQSQAIDKLAVLQRLQIFEIINFQVAKFCIKDLQDPDYFAKTTILAFTILKEINEKFSTTGLLNYQTIDFEKQDKSLLSMLQNSQINKQIWDGISSFEYDDEFKKYLDGYLKNHFFMNEIYHQSSLILRSPINEDYLRKLFDNEDKEIIYYIKFLGLMLIKDDLRDSHNKEIQELQRNINEEFLSESEFSNENLEKICEHLEKICEQISQKEMLFYVDLKKQVLEFFLKELKISSHHQSLALLTDSNASILEESRSEANLVTSRNSLKRSFKDQEFNSLISQSSQSSISISSLINSDPSTNPSQLIGNNQVRNLKKKSSDDKIQSQSP